MEEVAVNSSGEGLAVLAAALYRKVSTTQSEGSVAATTTDGRVLQNASAIVEAILSGAADWAPYAAEDEELKAKYTALVDSSHFNLQLPQAEELSAALAKRSFLVHAKTITGVDFLCFGASHSLVKSLLAQPDDAATGSVRHFIRWFTRIYGMVYDESEASKILEVPSIVVKQKKCGIAAPLVTRPLDDVNRLQILVGEVKEAWPHPESDVLFCEVVDCGEAEPRKIASGIRPQVALEKLLGAKVLVLANMKVKVLRGYPSHGMLLCSSNSDHTAFELMQPHADAKVGTRVVFEGLEPADADEVLSNKKNQEPLPAILPDLHTNAERQGMYKTFKMLVEGRPCTCDSLADAHIS